jgi:chromate reductase
MSASNVRLLGVCGSLQARSGNHALLETARACAPPGVEVMLFEGLHTLPLFDPDVDASGAPEPVLAWRAGLEASDALLVATPEYGFSLPGALKNAIDWVIGSGEIEGKIVAITASVNIAGRGRRGLEALADTLRALNTRILGGAGIVRGPTFEREVVALLEAVAAEARDPAPPPEHGFGALRPTALVEAWLEAANRGDADALVRFYAEQAVYQHVSEAPVAGRVAIAQRCAQGSAGRTQQRSVERLLEDGDWAILEWREPQGRRGCTLFEVRSSRIVSQRGY